MATHDKDDVLGFADDMLVLHDHQIISQGTPQNLYDNPKLPLIASFFGEYNVIDGKIYYAHQVQIVETSERQAIVEKSYFNGESWLIRAEFNGDSIFIDANKSYKKGSSISIVFSS